MGQNKPNLYEFIFYRNDQWSFLIILSGMEIVGPSKRVWAGVVIEYFFAIGLVVLAGIAYAIREWKYIEIAVSVPSVFFLLYWW